MGGGAVDVVNYLREERGICLSPQQREAVEAPPGRVLLLAVPGAGKTTVLAARIARLLAEGEEPGRILTITFSRESARDLTARWERLFGGLFPGRAPAFSTFHSFCYGLLRESAGGKPLPPLLVEEGKEVHALLEEHYRRLTGGSLGAEEFRRARDLMSCCLNMEDSWREIRSYDSMIPGFSRMLEEYTAWKRREGRMDFDDMLLSARELLEGDPAFAARVRGRYRHILVDEAQDLTKLQYGILRLFAGESLFVVGDEDQSIYGFRGAWPQGMLSFFRDLPAGEAPPRVMKLEDNFRSTQAIAGAAMKVIAQGGRQLPKVIRTFRGEGSPVRVLRPRDPEEEYAAVVRLLEKLPPGESCGVLYRTAYSGIALGWELRRRGIPFSARGTGLDLSRDAMSRDVAAFFRLAEDPGDRAAFRQACFRMEASFTLELVERALAAEPRDILRYIRDRLDHPGKNAGRLDWIRRTLRGMAGKPPLRQLDILEERLDYPGVMMGLQDHRDPFHCQRMAVLRLLAARSGDTASFFRRIKEASSVLDSPGEAAVRLTTVHSAKGQEFHRVILLDAVDGIFPADDAINYLALGHAARMEEEARLFYTAITRARDRVVIFAPKSFRGRELPPSRFLSALR